MRKTTLLTMAMTIGIASFSAYAAKPVQPDPQDLGVACACDWSGYPGNCTVTWDDVGASTYGIELALQAEWVEAGSNMTSKVDVDLDTWTCGGGGCTASGDIALPYFPDDAEVAFDAAVKGFENRGGPVPRNFAKDTGACNLP